MPLAEIIVASVVASALIWVGYSNLFLARRRREDWVRRTAEYNRFMPRAPLLLWRFLGASMLLIGILFAARILLIH